MSIPHFDFPDSPHIAGDVNPHDAEAIDNLVESKAEPPTPEEMPVEPKHTKLVEPTPATRLITRTINVSNSWAPVQLLPASKHRKTCRIILVSSTATDYIQIADDAGKLQGVSLETAGIVTVGVAGVDLAGHTGPVWVWAGNAAGTVTVSAICVAEGVDK